MKIKTRILIIISAFSLLVLLAGGAFMSIFYFRMLSRQEKQDFDNRSNNLVSFMKDQTLALHSTLMDWARWDDTYVFNKSFNQGYIEANLTTQKLLNLNASFMYFHSFTTGKVYSVFLDRQDEAFVAFPADVLSVITGDLNAMEAQRGAGSDRSWVEQTGSGYYFISRALVTDSRGALPPDGVMYIGRRIDSNILTFAKRISESGVLLLSVDSVPAVVMERLAKQPPDANGIHAVRVARNSNSMVTYIDLNASGLPSSIVMQVTSDRGIYSSGLTQYFLMLLTFLVLISLIIAALLRMLDKYISKPVIDLTCAISAMNPSAKNVSRLAVKGKSELAVLSQSINKMLDKIDQNYSEINKLDVRFSTLAGTMKQGFVAFEVLLDTGRKAYDYKCLYANDSFLSMFGMARESLEGKTIMEVFPILGAYWVGKYGGIAATGGSISIEESMEDNGRFYELSIYSPQPLQVVALVTDVTERRMIAEEREYTSYHDQLTGLYNRRYFEEAMKRIDRPENYPLSVIIGDLNGLKFTNDAFGHGAGDSLLVSVAGILREACRADDIIARWGGDEFTILLPNTTLAEVSAVCTGIRSRVARIELNSMRYAISLGYETKQDGDMDIKTALKQAEDYMYRRKMTESMNGRGNAIHAIMTTFKERNERERDHSNRVSRLCRLTAEAMGFSDEQAADMEITGLVHDIGKIAISDAIINKQGKLTPAEWYELKQHPEIGCRILCASHEMLDIAGVILAHHERWDGLGYPKGLADDQIPLQARILSVADSYDAITSERPYKQKMSVPDAVAELRRCAGTQFDPAVVDVFVEKVLGSARDIVVHNMDYIDQEAIGEQAM